MNLRYPLFLILLITLFLAACANTSQIEPAQLTATQVNTVLPSPSAGSTAVPEPSATVLPAATETAVVPVAPAATTEPPTLTSLPLPAATEAVPLITSGQTEEGAFFLGDPAAPLTIIDYSDFL